MRFKQGSNTKYDLTLKFSGTKLCWRLSVQAPFILVDTWLSSILLDRDKSVDRIIKVKLVFSKLRDKSRQGILSLS